MANKNSEPNAQNSEINPATHPSGARIENMMKKAKGQKEERLATEAQETGTFGDIVRDSELPDTYENAKGGAKDGHRSSPNNREV